MTRVLHLLIPIILIGALSIALSQQASKIEPVAQKSGQKAALAERGKYLVTISACNDCHTPFKMGPKGPEPDMTKMLSGHPESLKLPPAPVPKDPWIWGGAATNTAYYGPWGITYAPNLTPDQNTGMGIWTEDIFVKAMRTGKHFGTSRPIMPPMPWQSYSKMTDEDLKAIYAYLRSIPPIKNTVPDYIPPPEQK
jgi:mono/diheme cytochrome c family protein